jgi:hypothetical protein
VKNERHAIACRALNQGSGRICFSKLPGTADNLVKRITQSALLVNQARRVTHDVHEQNVANLELNLLLDLSGHLVAPANASAFQSMNNRWRCERRDQARSRK